jgi:hypothetical protein
VKRTILIIVVSALLFYSAQSFATYYKWTDEKGKEWITDYPNPKKVNKKAPAEAVKNKSNAQESAPSGFEDRTRKNSEGKGLLFIPDDIRKKIDNFAGVHLPGLSSSTVILIVCLAVCLIVVFYLYLSLCLFLIARRLAISDAWIAFVPDINLLTLVRAAGMPQWWTAIMFILMFLTLTPVFGIIFSLLFDACFVYSWMLITHNLGKNRWLGLLMIVPIANIIFPGFLAFSKERELPEPEAAAPSNPGKTMQDFSSDRWP